MNRHIKIKVNNLFFFIPVLLFLLALGIFSILYLSFSYMQWIAWWFELKNCFVMQDVFLSHYFTPQAKQAGNIYCLIALVLSTALFIHLLRKIKKTAEHYFIFNVSLTLKDVLCLIVLVSGGLMLWLHGKALVPVIGDEVFSGWLIAKMHPFQIWAYYMVPNNHILFNLANKILFFPVADKVFSGTLLSLIAYLLIIIVLFIYLRGRLYGGRWMAFFSVALLMSQFSLWAFSFEARGYECQALAGWLGLIALLEYRAHRGQQWLYWFLLSCVVGLALVPTYLFIYASFLGFCLFLLNPLQKKNIPFWRSQIYVVFFTFLFYLPTLCFSGLKALAGNKYVSGNISVIRFLQQPSPIRSYMDYCFSFFYAHSSLLGMVLFLLPLVLLTLPKNTLAAQMGRLYISLLIITTLMVVIIIRQYPFHRVLIVHFSFILFALLCLFDYFLHWVAKGKRWIIMPLSGLLIIIMGYRMLSANFDKVHFFLYFGDLNILDAAIKKQLQALPPHETLATSTAAFNWGFYANKQGFKVSLCPKGDEDIYINMEGDSAVNTHKYYLYAQSEGYNIYRKR